MVWLQRLVAVAAADGGGCGAAAAAAQNQVTRCSGAKDPAAPSLQHHREASVSNILRLNSSNMISLFILQVIFSVFY